MPYVETRGDSKISKRKIAGPKAAKAKKAKKRKKAPKAKQAQVVKPKRAPAFHEQTATTGAEHPTSAGEPFGGVGSMAGATPRSVTELTGINASSAEGLTGAIIDLVGEGKLTISTALAAWTHEQNRLANRAWRRPGGLQRMGGL